MTGRAAIVEPAQHSQRFWHHLDAQLCGAFPDQHFAAPRVEGGEQAFARRRVVNPFGTSGNTDELLDSLIIGLDIFVANGPIFSPPVLKALGLEVEWTETIAAAAPQVGSAAYRS